MSPSIRERLQEEARAFGMEWSEPVLHRAVQAVEGTFAAWWETSSDAAETRFVIRVTPPELRRGVEATPVGVVFAADHLTTLRAADTLTRWHVLLQAVDVAKKTAADELPRDADSMRDRDGVLASALCFRVSTEVWSAHDFRMLIDVIATAWNEGTPP